MNHLVKEVRLYDRHDNLDELVRGNRCMLEILYEDGECKTTYGGPELYLSDQYMRVHSLYYAGHNHAGRYYRWMQKFYEPAPEMLRERAKPRVKPQVIDEGLTRLEARARHGNAEQLAAGNRFEVTKTYEDGRVEISYTAEAMNDYELRLQGLRFTRCNPKLGIAVYERKEKADATVRH
jgi:hypothetical protein